MSTANGNLSPAHPENNRNENNTSGSLKNGTSFIKNILTASLIAVLISVYPVYIYCTKVQVHSVITGYLISLMNAMIGYGMNEMALKKSAKSFMAIVFGGMGIRIILAGIFLLIAIEFTNLNSVFLVSSVFVFYIIFMSLEIHYLHKKQVV